MNQNLEIWNSAKRLHDILTRAQQVGHVIRPNRRKPTIREVFAQVFDVPQSNSVKLFKYIGLMIDALAETSTQIEAAKLKNPEPYVRNFPALENALGVGNLDAEWPQFGDKISDQALADLLHASTRLSEIQGEVNLEDEELRRLAEDLAALIEQIHSASISDELRAGLIEMLMACREILDEYRIRGGDALRKIVETATGHLVVRHSLFSTPDEQGVLKNLFSWLGKADRIYTRLGKYVPLLSVANKLLGNEGE